MTTERIAELLKQTYDGDPIIRISELRTILKQYLRMRNTLRRWSKARDLILRETDLVLSLESRDEPDESEAPHATSP